MSSNLKDFQQRYAQSAKQFCWNCGEVHEGANTLGLMPGCDKYPIGSDPDTEEQE